MKSPTKLGTLLPSQWRRGRSGEVEPLSLSGSVWFRMTSIRARLSERLATSSANQSVPLRLKPPPQRRRPVCLQGGPRRRSGSSSPILVASREGRTAQYARVPWAAGRLVGAAVRRRWNALHVRSGALRNVQERSWCDAPPRSRLSAAVAVMVPISVFNEVFVQPFSWKSFGCEMKHENHDLHMGVFLWRRVQARKINVFAGCMTGKPFDCSQVGTRHHRFLDILKIYLLSSTCAITLANRYVHYKNPRL